MRLRSGRGFAAFAAAFLLVATSVVLVASAAPSPRPLKYACASNLYNAKNVLHYVSRPSQCRGSGKTLVNFASDFPVYVCRKEHGGFASANAKRFPYPRGIRSYGPAGLIRLVSAPSKCAPLTQPNETPMTLPGSFSRLFCAAKKGGELRWVQKVKDCDRKEFPVKLAKRIVSDQGEPMVPAADSATTDENTPTNVDVLANDRGSDTIGAVDTTGTTGTVTVNSDNTIKYDPAGKFESLKPGQTATDRFTYTGKQGTRQSDSATVTITITGVNDAPVAHDDAASSDSAHVRSIPVLSNDTDAEGDSLTSGLARHKRYPGQRDRERRRHDHLRPERAVRLPAGGPDRHRQLQVQGERWPHQLERGDGRRHHRRSRRSAGGDHHGRDDAVHRERRGDSDRLGVTISDPDSVSFDSAQVRIAADSFQSGDTLDYTSPGPGGITGFYDGGTGVLSLTGPASKADWQAALRTVKFRSDNDNPATPKPIEFRLNDGNSDSAPATKQIDITNVNDAPTVNTSSGQASFTEDSLLRCRSIRAST